MAGKRGTLTLSRRGFLQAAGVGRRRHHPHRGPALGQTAQVLGPDAVTFTLRVNGTARPVTVEPRVTLRRLGTASMAPADLDALRRRAAA